VLKLRSEIESKTPDLKRGAHRGADCSYQCLAVVCRKQAVHTVGGIALVHHRFDQQHMRFMPAPIGQLCNVR